MYDNEELNDELEICYNCFGKGVVTVECEMCNGTGISIENSGEDCPYCNGEGLVEKECDVCEGSGYIQDEERNYSYDDEEDDEF